MIDVLIWSKDRACQLDLLLRSMFKNLPNFESCSVHIIYKASDEKFQQGYDIIRQKYDMVLIKENDFYTDTMFVLNNYDSHILFLADDNIFYRYNEISPDKIVSIMHENDVCCFSLRLGLNTVIQDYYHQRPTDFPKTFEKVYYDVLMWNWRLIARYHNFGYPFALDAHIYNKQDVLAGLDFEFQNTTHLEGQYCQQVNHFKPHMCCLINSVSFNNPTNTIANSGLPSGRDYGNSLEFLNDHFINGHKISLSNIEQTNIVGCHQEVEMILE
jgi:hypothetical protein